MIRGPVDQRRSFAYRGLVAPRGESWPFLNMLGSKRLDVALSLVVTCLLPSPIPKMEPEEKTVSKSLTRT